MRIRLLLTICGILVFLPLVMAHAQVLGPCTGDTKAEAVTSGEADPPGSSPAVAEMVIHPVPLPGQQAIDFELQAVVGNDIKSIKLSDYQGKWRIVCFFPAAFTFV